jgi:aspartate aminotransferase-like enzyme
MKNYTIPMIPGPVRVPAEVRKVYEMDFGSGDLEPEFLELYNQTEAALQKIFATQNKVVIQTGEGMLALWTALKSCLNPGDRVLALATGVFGYGFGEMAAQVGAEVRTVGFEYDETFTRWDEIEQAVREFRPKMITAIHCETPSGTLNPMAQLGDIKRRLGVPLLVVDVVASLGGAPVRVDEWGIDLALGGSQKVLSVPPSMSFLTVSPGAWEIIAQVNYAGYEALLPFRDAQQNFYFPYTPYWHGVAALNAGAELLLKEGLENVFARHERAAQACREGIAGLGLELFPKPGAVSSPTVTAVKVPAGIPWPELDRRFRAKGLTVGGSYGPLANKVFRLGHMGSQADVSLVEQAIRAMGDSL